MVEGVGVANVESWTVAYTGTALTYTISSGLVAKKAYRLRVKAISEHALESGYSSISTYYAAALPAQI